MSLNSLRDGFNRAKKKYDDFNRQHNVFPSSQPYQQGPPQPYYPAQQGQQQQPFYPQPQQQYQYNQPQQYSYSQQPYPPQQQQLGWQQNGQYQQNFSSPPPAPEWSRPPPPVPQHSHPSQQPQPLQQPINRRYWQASLDPSISVSQEWEHKLGNNNGWGNNELEHYTANSENAFFTGDNKLIIRAIVNNGSPSPEGKYTSARLVSRQTLSRPRGVLTAYLTSPCATGIWPAFWLLPREPFHWPDEGEIDIAETWNGDRNNKSCLHWGTYTPQDASKHRTMGTQINDMSQRAVRYDFAWDQHSGRMLWYIDERPVMKAMIPQGTRPLHDWCVLFNVAMGGNVCGGQLPKDGAYDFIVHAVYMCDELEIGGWQRFDGDWQHCPEGKSM